MGDQENWVDFGDADELAAVAIGKVTARNTTVAVSCTHGQFGAISNVCNHAGGPLGEGRLDGDYIVCPWHNWKFHRVTGIGEPGFGRRRRAGLSGEGRERPRAGRPRQRHQAPQEAARAASAGAPGRARAGAGARGRASRPRRWTRPTRASRAPIICSALRSRPARARRARRDSSGSTSSSFARAKAITRRARGPAPGRARSRRWTAPTR